MTLSVAALTHRPAFSRIQCPCCERETLHRGYTCCQCKAHHPPPPKPKKPAYGARLVIARFPKL